MACYGDSFTFTATRSLIILLLILRNTLFACYLDIGQILVFRSISAVDSIALYGVAQALGSLHRTEN
jgi:hypothetical protein